MTWFHNYVIPNIILMQRMRSQTCNTQVISEYQRGFMCCCKVPLPPRHSTPLPLFSLFTLSRLLPRTSSRFLCWNHIRPYFLSLSCHHNMGSGWCLGSFVQPLFSPSLEITLLLVGFPPSMCTPDVTKTAVIKTT